MPPLLSVIVPVHGTADTLRGCLDSIVAQSFGDFEVVLVDDGSPDDAPAIMREYAARDSRVRCHRHSVNRNLYAARITGFELARGEYLTVCDSDDKLPPGALAAFAGVARGLGPDVAHGRAVELDGRRDGRSLCNCDPFTASTGRDFVHAMLDIGRGWNVWGKLFRSEVVKTAIRSLPRDVNWFMLEDLLFCVWFGSRSGKYVGIRDIVYRYRFPVESRPAEDVARRSFEEAEVMGFLWNSAAVSGLDARTVLAMEKLFRRQTAYIAGRLPPEFRGAFLEKIDEAIGPGFAESIASHSGRAFLSPRHHVSYLAEYGIGEYFRWLRTLGASATRMGLGASLKRIAAGR